jgi:hypothetical protein
MATDSLVNSDDTENTQTNGTNGTQETGGSQPAETSLERRNPLAEEVAREMEEEERAGTNGSTHGA